MELFLLVFSVSIILFLAPMISALFNVSVVVVEIFLGMLGGYFGLIYHDLTFVQLAKFGFLYLMFLAGHEINLKLVEHIKKTLALQVVLYFAMLYGVAAFFCVLFGLGVVYFVALPIFSLGMLMMLIKEYGKDEEWLNLALSIGVVGEVVSILVLTIFSGWLTYGFGLEFYTAILSIMVIVALGVLFLRIFQILFWWYPDFKKYIIPDSDQYDQDIRFTLALFFIMTALMAYLKIDAVLGAFVAGLFLKMFFHHHYGLTKKLEAFGFGLFAPIFFIYVGSTIDLDVVNSAIITHAFFIILLMVLIRLISSFVAFYKYLKFKPTILFALSDSMPLTFMVALAMIAYKAELITHDIYIAFVLASMIDGLILMILIRKLYTYFKQQGG
ncbi:MAG: sodium:proton antiporter [Sulfurovum sp. FS08-3]|nr:MAG: sodium:proton antiporter [Sulfurovum sp. FS08-3]